MAQREQWLGSLLVEAGAASVRLHRLVGLRPLRSQRVLFGFLGQALHASEKSRLGVAIYQTSPFSELRRLTWEADWFAARLPPPPARVLVGACGSGPEVLHLLERGYRVDAFDPAQRLLELCRRRVAGRSRLFVASYEDLSQAVLDGREAGCAELVTTRFDAVLLGLASLNHVLVADERARLFRAVDALCPTGPILASFMMHRDHGRRRAFRLGEAAGRWVGRARGVQHTEGTTYESVVDGLGFIHELFPDEIRELASSIDREVILEEAPDNGTLATFVVPSVEVRGKGNS